MPRKSWIDGAPAVVAAIKKTRTMPPARKRRALPDLRELERAESRRREQEWQDDINAGSEPPRWLPRRPHWLRQRGRWP